MFLKCLIFFKKINIDDVLKKLGKNINYDETFKYFENPIIDDSKTDFNIDNPDLNNLNRCLVENHGLIN